MHGRCCKEAFLFFALFACSAFAPHCAVSLHAQSSEGEKTVITIENAQSTVYEKDKETGNDTIVFEGDVRISVEKGSTKTKIGAPKIIYDRKTQMLYASGGITMEMTGCPEGNSTATASSLMLNTSTLEGVFDDGRVVQTQSDALNLPSGSTLIVASKMFGRSQSNTIAFKNGSLTFCDDENPHWHIDASRIWLLPGGEFAFFNALLYVGVVPVLYLPAFYYPKDELVFNPVFSYDTRRGYSIQTTAYLYGRKPLDASSTTTASSSSSTSDASENLKALFNFMKPSTLKEQKLEGIVLHNLDEDYKGDTTNYFKIMGDWYSNLGFFVGVDGVFKPNTYITNVKTLLQIAFSNTVFRNTASGEYIPYAPSGKKYRDSSNFMGLALPFRYGADFQFTLSKPFTLSLSLPIYSDPYFTDDYAERNETMNWISYLTELGAKKSTDDKKTNEISSFSWRLNSSYSFPFTANLKSYISSMSITLNSSIVFSSLTNSAFTVDKPASDVVVLASNSPMRKFYYPSQITPASVSFSWIGTLFSYSSTSSSSRVVAKTPPSMSLVIPDEFKTEKELEAESAKQAGLISEENDSSLTERNENTVALAAESDNAAAQSDEKSDAVVDDDDVVSAEDYAKKALPALTVSAPSVATISGFDYKLTYSIKPTISSQLAYSSTGLTKPEDFKWNNLRSSMYTLKTPIALESEAKYGGSFFTMTNSITYSPVIQEHPYISTDTAIGGYTDSALKSLKLTDYKASKQEIINTNSVSLKPFSYINLFKNTGISYRSSIKLLRREFLGDDANNPQWKYYGPDFTEENSITTHELAFTYAMTEGANDKFGQSLMLSMKLPPQVDEYTGTLSFAFPYTTFSLSTGFQQTSSTDATWKKKPIQQAFSLSLFKNTLKLTESYNYNWEKKHSDGLRISLSWQGLQIAYTMSYTKGYNFDADTYDASGKITHIGRGWEQQSEEKFLPYSFSLSYTMPSNTWYLWKRRIKIAPGLSTSITADLLRPTNSYFLFTPSLNFEINKFLTFTFSATSRNAVLYRYFQKMFGHEGRIPGEANVFVDLWNSFRFDDESKRRASGFKLQSLNFTLTHDLHDWDFKTEFKVSPRLVTENSKRYYDFSPYVTISVVWRPMESMKTKIVDEYGEWQLNP